MILQLIISYLTVVLTLAVQVLSFKKLISEKLNITPLKVVIILIFSLLVILNNLLIPGPFKGLVTILLLYCLSKIWFKKSNKVTLYYTIILAIISLLLDLFISLVILSPKYSGVNEINKDFLPKSAITMIMNICMYFIVCIPKFKMIINKFEELILNKKRYDLLFMVALIIVNLITSIYIKDYANYEIFLAFIVIIIFISILIYNLLKSVFQQDKLQIKFDYLQENIKNYEDIADDYSELKHNLNHDLLAIKSVAGTNKANKLIDEIINKYNKNYHWITRVGNIPKGIQGILYIKLYEIKNQNINVEVDAKEIKDITEKISVENYSKLCDFIGITLDNAIEAAKKSEEKSVFINFKIEKNVLITKIMNTFKDNLDLNQLGTKNYSTKKIKSGLGLNYLSKITNKKIKIKKEIINNVFIVSLSLPLKK